MFIAYPAALVKMRSPTLWAILFFLMLLLMGLGSQFIMVHTVLTGIVDEFPNKLYKHKVKVLLLICVSMYLIGLPFISQVCCVTVSQLP